jgi:hypothetical protein
LTSIRPAKRRSCRKPVIIPPGESRWWVLRGRCVVPYAGAHGWVSEGSAQ